MVSSVLNDRRIVPGDILHALINLQQLVFEVTDACNLRCKYCAYGDMYFGYDKREDSFLPIEKGKAIIDYLSDIWDAHITSAQTPMTYVSFYGGEPLMNMPFIVAIVDYVKKKKLRRKIQFAMTTNGMLLDKYEDFLAENNFNVLISLDGDEYGHSYRVTKAGTNSHPRVYGNIKHLQEKHPEFFKEHVNFNTVLHNRNDVESVFNYVMAEFGKEPQITELNNSNIREDKKAEFDAMYKNKAESIDKATDREGLVNRMFMGDANTADLLLFLHQHSGNFFKDYSDLLINPQKMHYCPTGTCIPFGKKMFVTVNGKIIQCERISQEYGIGQIDDSNKVHLDLEEIAAKVNALMDKVQSQCSACFKKKSCIQCLYYIDGINTPKAVCQAHMNKKMFEEYAGGCMAYLYEHPDLYPRLMKDVAVS